MSEEAIIVENLRKIYASNSVEAVKGLRQASLEFLVIFLIAMMVAFVLGGISLALAAKIKTIETLMAVVNTLTMPLLFSSNALFPTSVMQNGFK